MLDQPFEALGCECYWPVECFGSGTMEVDLRQVGTASWARNRLKVSIKTPVSWSAHALSVCQGNAIGASGLAYIYLAQCMVDICIGECEAE